MYLEKVDVSEKVIRVRRDIEFAEAFKCFDYELIRRQPSFWINNLLNYYEAKDKKIKAGE